MKTCGTRGSISQLRNTCISCALIVAGLLLCLISSLAQEEAPPLPPPLNLPLAAAEDAADSGTFWSLQVSNSPPLPFNPFPDLTVYDLGGGQFLFDDRMVDYVALEQQRQLERELLRAAALSLGLAIEEDESGGGLMMAALHTTNDLWLETIGVTNLEFNSTAYLVIHPPEGMTNEVYDLYSRTNLNLDSASTFSLRWSRIQRTTPG